MAVALSARTGVRMTLDEITEHRRRRYNATVTYLRKVHSELMIVRVNPDFPKPAHRAGQYASLGLGRWEPRLPGCQDEVRKPGDESRLVRRTYSFSCSILGNRGELLELDKENW